MDKVHTRIIGINAKRAGNRTLAMALVTVTSPSSRGWRSASHAMRENSGSSPGLPTGAGGIGSLTCADAKHTCPRRKVK
jgi:hypothetical protein